MRVQGEDTHGGRRGVVIVVLAAVLVAVALLDRGDRAGVVRAGPANDMPVAAPAGALSSSWYCAGGTAQSGAPANATVSVANTGAREIAAVVTVIPNEGQRAVRRLKVPPYSVRPLRLVDVVKAPFAAATVDVDGGGVVVEQTVTGTLGESSTACASAASSQWYFADGATRRESTMFVSLFNPFPENAIADFSFSTDQGRAVPRALQGLVVPARSVVVRNIGEFVRRRETVAATISVRTGRLVASKLQLHDGGGRKGMSLTLGAPSAGPEWRFTDGYIVNGVTERLAIYNPGQGESRVDVEVTLDKGAAEPFELTVPARERLTLDLSEEGRIPDQDAHAITVLRRTGPDVVVERTFDAVPPAPRSGFVATMGARRTATRWATAAGAATEDSDEWLVVHNPSSRPARLSVTALAGQQLAVEGLQRVTVPAGRRMSFRLGDHIQRPELPLLIESSVPIVVERAVYRVGAIGTTGTMAIPLL